MDVKVTITPPVCCILRMFVGIDQCNYIFGLGDHSYETVTSESGYPMMQCEYYCALCTLQWTTDSSSVVLLRLILM